MLGLVLLVFSAWPAIAAVATNGFRLLDLTQFVTGSERLERQFARVPKGAQTFDSVPFLVGTPMGVNGMEGARAGQIFPTEITGIAVGMKVRRLHLLHGTIGPDKDGIPVAKIVFRYADGSSEARRLGYGVHVRDWTKPEMEKRSALIDPNSRVAWVDGDSRTGGEARLFHTALLNPRPDEAVASIDIVSLFSQATPLIAAISAEEPGASRQDNLPLPDRKAVREMNEFPDSIYRGEFVVRTKDGATGRPLTNATVSLTIAEEKEKVFWTEKKPDADGVCRLVYPPQQAAGYTIWVHAPGLAPAMVTESRTNQSAFRQEHVVTLQRGTTAGGVVKQTGGQPVAGAQVIIHRVIRVSPHHYERTDYDLVTTGPDGKWTSTSLPPDLSGFSFHVFHDDYAPGNWVTAGFAPPPPVSTSSSSSSSTTYRSLPDGTLVPMTASRTTARPSVPLLETNALRSASAEMVVRPAIRVEGIVVRPDGAPAPNAEVHLVNTRSSTDRKRFTTAADGRFQFRVPDPGNIALAGLVDGFAPFHRMVMAQAGMAPVKVQLTPPRVLSGRVRDRKQNPIPGASVRLDQWAGTTDLIHFQAITDNDGRFLWSNAPSGTVTFYVSKTNYINTRQSFSVDSAEIAISMNRAAGVYGRVYDAETKKPIPSFTIVPGRKYSANDRQIRWERYEAERGYNGEYALRIDTYMFQPEARVLVEAPGYQAQISPAFNGPDSYTNDFALKKGEGISGVVLLPDGSPAVNATLVLAERGENASLDSNGRLRGSSSGDIVRSDAQGRFNFVPKLDPLKIFASHEQGYAEAAIGPTNRIVLQKWGSVKGSLRVGDKIEPEQSVRLQNHWDRYTDESTRMPILSFYLKADLQPDGSFHFEKVPPGEHRIALEYRFRENQNGGETPLSHGFMLDVKPGATATAVLGGTGRRIVGKVELSGGDHSDVDWKRDVHKLTLVLPPPVSPPNLAGQSATEQQRAWNEYNQLQRTFWSTDAGRAHERKERTYVLVFETNGQFRVDNVPPGKYNLFLNVSDPEEEYYSGRAIGQTNMPVAVPDERNAQVNAPLDIGAVHLAIRPRIRIGKVVPSFSGKGSDGKAIQLSDHRGKFVVLHFWGLSMGYSTADLQMLKELQSNFGADGKLVILGCNLDGNEVNAKQFVTRQGMTWAQMYLGEWSQTTIPGMFGLQGNTGCVLISPDGKLASAILRSSNIRTVVSNAINSPDAIDLP
jgi:hypothetical protein